MPKYTVKPATVTERIAQALSSEGKVTSVEFVFSEESEDEVEAIEVRLASGVARRFDTTGYGDGGSLGAVMISLFLPKKYSPDKHGAWVTRSATSQDGLEVEVFDWTPPDSLPRAEVAEYVRCKRADVPDGR